MRLLRLFAILAIPAQLAAQQTPATPVGTTLSLEEAISLAQQNNPLFMQTKNALRNADANVRSSYGSLLPQASARIGTAYTQGGTQYVQGVALPTNPDTYSSQYFIGLSYGISAAVAYIPRATKANRTAAEADITSAAIEVTSAAQAITFGLGPRWARRVANTILRLERIIGSSGQRADAAARAAPVTTPAWGRCE